MTDRLEEEVIEALKELLLEHQMQTKKIKFLLLSLTALIKPMIKELDINPDETGIMNSDGEKISLTEILELADEMQCLQMRIVSDENNIVH